MKKILFVCTGNTCRSPMAEAMLKSKIPPRWRRDLEISSAGTAAEDSEPASSLAVEVLGDAGIDLSTHSARLLSRELIEEADLIVIMSGEHGNVVHRIAPDVESEVILLGELDRGRSNPDIEDPIGGDRDTYTRSRDEIGRLIDLLIGYLIDKYGLKE